MDGAPSQVRAEPKFKPRVPASGPRGKVRVAASPPVKLESSEDSPVKVKIEQGPSNPVSVVENASLDLEPNVKMDAMDIDVKLDPMDILDDMDVKVKVEGGAVVWEGLDGSILPKEETKQEPMSVDNEKPSGIEGDRVVREIDVHLVPTVDADTKLYLLQYPLRPYWRPYGLEDKCQEVRVKHQHNKLEVDLVIDTFGENYDHEADDHLKITKQTLTSTQGNLSTSYAIGILQGNKLHLNPLHAIVQLRPSLKYMDEADETKKKNITRIESDDEMADADEDIEEIPESKPQPVAFKVEIKKQETERQQQSRLMSYAHLKQLEEAEPWIALEPHGLDSPVTEGIRMKMKGSGSSPIPFAMHSHQYLGKLVPGRPTPSTAANTMRDGIGREPLSKSYLDTLPLEKRLHTVLAQGRVHVLQFERLMKLAPPGCTEEQVLDVLQKTAYLVQGCWVATSNMRYSGPICVIRDYILLQFVKNRVVTREKLEEFNVSKEVLRELLLPLAVQNVKSGGWEFIESTDKTFIKRHSSIAKDQLQRWVEAETFIKDKALSLQSVGTGNKITLAADGKANPGISGSANLVAKSSSSTMSHETLAALPGALREIFLKHHVCNLQFICHCLREMAITKSQADVNPQEKGAAVAAAKGASAPVAELTSVINQVATNIDSVFFLTTLGDPTLDPFREVVIALLRQKGSSSGLQKSEIMETSKIALKKLPSNPVYQKVMKELCYTRGATWVLKTGDGRPS